MRSSSKVRMVGAKFLGTEYLLMIFRNLLKEIVMRILVLTLMMSFLSHSAFGAEKASKAIDAFSDPEFGLEVFNFVYASWGAAREDIKISRSKETTEKILALRDPAKGFELLKEKKYIDIVEAIDTFSDPKFGLEVFNFVYASWGAAREDIKISRSKETTEKVLALRAAHIIRRNWKIHNSTKWNPDHPHGCVYIMKQRASYGKFNGEGGAE